MIRRGRHHLAVRHVEDGVEGDDRQRKKRDGLYLVLQAREKGLGVEVQDADDERGEGDDELLLQRVVSEQGKAAKQKRSCVLSVWESILTLNVVMHTLSSCMRIRVPRSRYKYR